MSKAVSPLTHTPGRSRPLRHGIVRIVCISALALTLARYHFYVLAFLTATTRSAPSALSEDTIGTLDTLRPEQSLDVWNDGSVAPLGAVVTTCPKPGACPYCDGTAPGAEDSQEHFLGIGESVSRVVSLGLILDSAGSGHQ